MTASTVFLFFAFLIGNVLLESIQKECKLREVAEGKKVCVCDKKYCDTIPRPEKVASPRFLLYTSNKEGLRFKKILGKFNTNSSTGANSITIKRNQKKQVVMGWGGAFTDSTGINIKTLPEKAQDLLLESYFGREGIEYDTGRVPIGGTDFSTHFYTYDDTENENVTDVKLERWHLQPEDFTYKIPFMKKARKLSENKLKFFGSTWGAPIWMKTNHMGHGNGAIIKEYYQTWAEYFVKFLQAYENQGLKIWAVTTQNEPSLAYLGFSKPIVSVGWTSIELANWIKNNLGPTIKNSNVSDTKIIILDDQKPLIPWYTNSVLDDDETTKYVSGIGVHWYMGAITPCQALIDTYNSNPGIFILSTEACAGFQQSSGVNLGDWSSGEGYTTDIIEDFRCRVSGWIDWNMVLDMTGGPTYIDNTVDSPIVVNATAGEFYKQPMYYHLGHHSKFVPSESIRIGDRLKLENDLLAVAYERPDNGIVVVILNKSDSDKEVTVNDEKVGVAKLKITKRSVNTLLYW